MNFSKRLSELRILNNLTQKELSKKLNVSQSTIGMWETEKRDPDTKTVQELAELFKVTTDYLLGKSNIKQPFESSKKKKGIKIPVLGRVVAGVPMEAVEDIIDYEEIDEDLASQGEYFALQIKGASMEPRIMEGDVIIVRKQSDVDSGNLAVVLVNGNEATVKRIIKQKEGITLIANNTSVYTPHFYTYNQIKELPITILGKVIELRGKF